MNAPTLVALSVGLAMDATAVAATLGIAAGVLRVRDVVRVAVLFGGAQALMPLLGWWLGAALGGVVRDYGPWMACLLLVVLGVKMLREARALSETDPRVVSAAADPFGLRMLMPLTVATSVDAFAVGITLPMLGAPMLSSALTIGAVTAAMSAAGALVGRRAGAILGPRLDLVGGFVLIGLGVKILIEHLR